MRSYKYVFGPVPSRRFGRSLGVDLVCSKTCTFDCVFCQLGRTNDKTPLRREYAPIAEVEDELLDWMGRGEPADCITFSGAGEPTLNSRFGEAVAFARDRSSIPVLLFTNSSLMHLPEVRRDASGAGVVKASLSAWDQSSFERVNRPCGGLDFNGMVEGLRRFRAEFSGRLIIEVFVIPGVNSAVADMKKIASLAASIGPERVQFNTAARPPAEDFVRAASRVELDRLSGLFDPPAEIVGQAAAVAGVGSGTGLIHDAVLATLSRHPCTAGDLAALFGVGEARVLEVLDDLARHGRIAVEEAEGVRFYVGARRMRYEGTEAD